MQTGSSLFRLCRQLAAILTLAMLMSMPAMAKDFYRWKDDAGVTHYSEIPPKDYPSVKVRASNIRVEVDDSGDAATTAETGTKTTDEPAAESTSAADPVKDPERCAIAQRNVETLKTNSRVRIKEDGEFRYLTPEEMAENLRVAQQIVDEEC